MAKKKAEKKQAEPTSSPVQTVPDQPVQTRQVEPEKDLLVWEAMLTVHKKRSREFFTTAGAIAFLVAVILFFLKEWFLIIFIIALFFYTYVMSTTKPPMTNHRLTNRGVYTSGRRYLWDELTTFWFTESFGQKILNIGRFVGFPRQLIMLLGDKKEEEVRKAVAQYLEEQAPEKDFVEKSSDWLTKKIPLEKE